jgi:hypothetical protein
MDNFCVTIAWFLCVGVVIAQAYLPTLLACSLQVGGGVSAGLMQCLVFSLVFAHSIVAVVMQLGGEVQLCIHVDSKS